MCYVMLLSTDTSHVDYTQQQSQLFADNGEQTNNTK